MSLPDLLGKTHARIMYLKKWFGSSISTCSLRSIFWSVCFAVFGCSVSSCLLVTEDGSSDVDQKQLNKVTGWSSSGTLFTGVKGNEVKLQAIFKDDPGNYSVEFNVQLPAVGNGPTSTFIYAAPEALITWTVKGNTVTRRVSVGDGVTVSGMAEGVNISVFDNSTQNNLAAAGGQGAIAYTVSIQVVKGLRPNTQQPPTLVALDPRPGVFLGLYGIIVQTGADVHVPIPQDAGVVSVFVTAFSLAPVRGVPASGAGDVSQTYDVPFGNTTLVYRISDASDQDTWTPVTPGSNAIVLQAFGVGQAITYTIMFGIDG
jgi:hypothetical protein